MSTPTLHPLLRLVDELSRHHPFQVEEIVQHTGTPLKPSSEEVNPFFTFYEGGPSPDGQLLHVDVRIPNGKGNRIDGKIILIVSPAAQLFAPQVRAHYGHPWGFSVPRVEVEPPQAHGLMWRFQWGMLRCGYKPNEADRVSSLILDADR